MSSPEKLTRDGALRSPDAARKDAAPEPSKDASGGEPGPPPATAHDGDGPSHSATASGLAAGVHPADPTIMRSKKSDLGVLEDVDENFTRLLGFEPHEAVGRGSLDFIHPDDQGRAVKAWMEVLEVPGGTRRVRLRHRHRDGHWSWLEITNHNLIATRGYVACEMVDISSEVEAREAVRGGEEPQDEDPATWALASRMVVRRVTDTTRTHVELEQRATYDALTGCLNRAATLATLEAAMSAGGPSQVAIIFVDLDNFKAVNDRHGHATGDMVLLVVAARLRDAVRRGDVVGRLGGDEFLIICPSVTEPSTAVAVGERIAGALDDPIALDEVVVRTSASMGVAFSGHLGRLHSPEALVAQADAAMYGSKSQGEGRPVLAAGLPSQPTPQRRATDIAAGLRTALSHRELEVHYQPVFSLSDMSVLGHEALLRWRRGERLTAAAEFIDVAEASGLISDMDAFVVDEVCQRAASVEERTLWFVNLSPLELATPRTAGAIRDALTRHRMDPAHLVVEATERVAIAQGSVETSVLSELVAMGASVALDDFGAGYSSLATLLEVPVRWLKVGQMFTAAASTSPGRKLLGGLVELAARIGAEMIAEGVETTPQLEALRDLGVGFAQGYLLAPPGPAVAT